MLKRRDVLVGVLLLWLASLATPLLTTRAASAPITIHPRVTYTFGEAITFEARFEPADAVREAVIFYRPQEQPETLHGPMTLKDDGSAFFVHDLAQVPLPPFVTVYYWFHLTLKDGSTYTSPSFTLQLEDNRFQWQHMSNPPFEVFWYQGDAPFAQRILDAADKGARRARETWSAPWPEAVKIYVYANAQDMQSALHVENWVAGHASPTRGALFITLADTPQQVAEIQRLVPHEIAHYLLYLQTGDNGYQNIPAWLNEGLATITELTPNSDYDTTLQQAAAEHRLIPLTNLCRDFPHDASGALLAYAEAASFTQYLLHRYGRSPVHALLAAYTDGMDCNTGAERTLGKSLDALDREWQAETLQIGRWSQALQRLLPWLLLLGGLLLSLVIGAWLVLPKT